MALSLVNNINGLDNKKQQKSLNCRAATILVVLASRLGEIYRAELLCFCNDFTVVASLNDSPFGKKIRIDKVDGIGLNHIGFWGELAVKRETLYLQT